MNEPLLRVVSPRAYCAAIYEGLAEWVAQEKATPGKQDPRVALDASAMAVLEAAVDLIRERAQAISAISVRIPNKVVRSIRTTTPSHVRHRLNARIGNLIAVLRYVEVPTDDGPLWVRPHYEPIGRDVFRISVRVQFLDDHYSMLGTVKTEPELSAIEIPFQAPFPPGYVERLLEQARRLHSTASAVPAMSERIRIFFEDLGFKLEARRRGRSAAAALQRVEVVRTGRIEIVEVGTRAVVGGAAISEFEEQLIEPTTELVNAIPTIEKIRELLDDLRIFYAEGARAGGDNLMDILDGSHATEEEMAEQTVVIERARDLSRQAATAAARYLEERKVIPQADEWIAARDEEVAEALHDRDGKRYMAQIARRLRKDTQTPLSMLRKQIEIVARRDVPPETSPEHAIVLAARGASELYAALPIFVPPLDQWFDGSMAMIMMAARAVQQIEPGEPPSL